MWTFIKKKNKKKKIKYIYIYIAVNESDFKFYHRIGIKDILMLVSLKWECINYYYY